MTLNSQLYGLRADTAIHAGTGESDGKVDLPIMREQHSGWPVVYGSAVKGALRAAAELVLDKDSDEVLALFGPDTKNASDHAGCLLISDARLLALPVRSLTSQYRLVTCPDLISRLQRDVERLGMSERIEGLNIPVVEEEQILTAKDEKHEYLFLEDFAYQRKTCDLSALAALMAQLANLDESDIADKLAVVSNDAFAHICQSAIPVNAHIALDSDTKTVTGGALWYEESLPSDTLLYVGISAWKPRRQGTSLATAEQCITVLDQQLFGKRPYLQLGGNETTGMGWCRVSALASKESV